jgi:UDP-GlcNAc:undecaprenyl-phosphate GlcNAc-1-phosphate transferase
MTSALAAVVGGSIGAAVTVAATPLAIRIAQRTDFLDRPRQYRKHGAPTPFLGGAAVIAAFVLATLAIGGGRAYVLLVCTTVMWAIGTIDDRVAVAPGWRVAAEAAAATALYAGGHGWRASGVPAVDCALTILWTVALVNAFNLMDNLDGACASVACASALGIGALAAIHGGAIHAGMAFALAGACAGFLRFNLARPARIFLGDGGSMPIGFLLAALGMIASRSIHQGGGDLLVVGLTAGVVLLDTTLVSVSRARRGVSLLTGGRDHLSHRLLGRLRTPRRVGAAMAGAQAGLGALAVLADRAGLTASVAIGLTAALAGLLTVAELDREQWRPAGIATAPMAAPGVAPAADVAPAAQEFPSAAMVE